MLSGEVGLYDLPSVATQRQAAKQRARRAEITASRTITAADVQRARTEAARAAAGAERRRVGEVLTSLTAAGAIDGNQAEALVKVLTNPSTGAHDAVEQYQRHTAKNAAGTGAAIASLYQRTMGR